MSRIPLGQPFAYSESIADQPSSGKSLLEQLGYIVRRLPASGFPANASPDDLLLIDEGPRTKEHADEFSVKMMRQGYRKIIILRDPDVDAPSRRRDSDTRVFQIPRLFTAFDIKWVEEQAQL